MNLQQQPVLVSLPSLTSSSNPMYYPAASLAQSYSAANSGINYPNVLNSINNSMMPPAMTAQTNVYSDVSTKAQIIAEIENEIQRLRLLESLLLTPHLSHSLPSLVDPISCLQMSSSQVPSSSFYSTPQLSLDKCSSSPEPAMTLNLSTTVAMQEVKSPDQASTSSTEDQDRPYKCLECNKRFRFKSNLFEHKSLHFSEQSYQYVCPFCSKICRLKGNLKKHLQTHMNTAEQLEQFWKLHFSRSSGRPRKYIRYSDVAVKNKALSESPTPKIDSPEVDIMPSSS